MPRRTFLRLAGLAALGILGAERVVGAVGVPAGAAGDTATAAAPDPIEVLAGDLEYDVERIFRFVADEVRYEPYDGILRGARGALAGRAGNSLDQALLLAALLDASGVPVRFVDASIDETTAGAVLATTAVPASVARDGTMAVLRGSGGTAAGGTPDIDAPSPDPAVRAAAGRIPEVATAIQAAARSQLDASLAMLGGGPRGRWGDAAADHVRAAAARALASCLGPGRLRSRLARPGPTLGPVARPRPPVGEPVATLPDELRHRVAFRVLRERLVGGALTEDLIVEHEAFADELAGEPLVLLHEKPAGLEALGVSVTGVLTGQTQYLPILQVGDRSLIGLAGVTLGGSGGALGGIEGEVDREGEATAEGWRSRCRRRMARRAGRGVPCSTGSAMTCARREPSTQHRFRRSSCSTSVSSSVRSTCHCGRSTSSPSPRASRAATSSAASTRT